MRRALVLVGVVLGACTPHPRHGTSPVTSAAISRYPPAEGVPGCPLYAEPRVVGHVPAVLGGLSGLAASTRHPGVLWAHNDSGHAPQLFALDVTGRVLATVNLTGLSAAEQEALDLEDVALGPCAPGEAQTCVYLADIGDTFERRAQVRLLRLPEPEQVADASLPVESLAFRYPDRPHDAGSLVLEPRTARPVVITKERDSLGQVFALEGLAPRTTGRATPLGTLRSPLGDDFRTTSAALHSSGQRLLLRTYTRVWEVRRPGAHSLEELLQGQVVEAPGASQAQAEALTFLPGERSYLLGSEFADQPLIQVDCR